VLRAESSSMLRPGRHSGAPETRTARAQRDRCLQHQVQLQLELELSAGAYVSLCGEYASERRSNRMSGSPLLNGGYGPGSPCDCRGVRFRNGSGNRLELHQVTRGRGGGRARRRCRRAGERRRRGHAGAGGRGADARPSAGHARPTRGHSGAARGCRGAGGAVPLLAGARAGRLCGGRCLLRDLRLPDHEAPVRRDRAVRHGCAAGLLGAAGAAASARVDAGARGDRVQRLRPLVGRYCCSPRSASTAKRSCRARSRSHRCLAPQP
jgi:hypothetical protein